MKTEQPEGGRTEGRPESNVVPLPRDWLGPREELVPFGPSANRAAAAGRDGEAGASLSAQSFWTEDSAAVHHPLEAPPHGVTPAASKRFGRLRALLQERIGGLRVRYARSAVVVVSALAAATVVVARLDHAAAPSSTGSALPGLTVAIPALNDWPSRAVGNAIAATAQRTQQQRVHARAIRRDASGGGHGAIDAPAAAAAPASSSPGVTRASEYTTPVASATTSAPRASASRAASASHTPTTSSTPATYQPPPAPVTRPSAPTGGGASATQASQSPPAFGANGVLGPGSSGDS